VIDVSVNKHARIKIFKSFGADDEQAEALFDYSQSRLTDRFSPDLSEDEPFAEAWKIYFEESKSNGVYNTLRKYLPQLSFPVKEGISKTEEYRSATLRGELYNSKYDLLICPDKLELDLYHSQAGHIPILFTECREDFITLVCALTNKNEPRTVPPSMGACMVKGFNNWDRVNRYRALWEAENIDKDWSEHFTEFKDCNELYQDRFIIMSNIGYSGLDAAAFNLSEKEWQGISFIIRREHECTHYLTQRVFGSARNNMFDELVADYAGIVKALGRFNASWFFKFVGLENYPEYRQGGRMDNYKGNPPLSDGAFIVLQRLVHKCALILEASNEHPIDTAAIIKLYKLSLEELAENTARQ